MKIGKVVGKLSLVKAHPTLVGRRWVIAQPQSLKALVGEENSRDEEVIIVDEMGATEDALIGITDGREAAAPFEPERKPVDAYVACILDELTVNREAANRLLGKAAR